MHELRAEELALTRGEMEELLAAHGVFLSDGDMDALLTRTEGWVAGARLCAMRMENAEYPGRFVSELALGEGSIGEYLVAEVLEGQPEPVRRLLTETSLFEEVTGPMADAVTGMEGCADMLARLAASNSFVIPVDAARTRFRYHQLLGEILRHELQWRERGMAPGLMRRAAAYFEGNGDFRRALYWAARAGDWATAASVLARGGLAHAFVNHDDIADLGFDVWPPTGRDGADAPQAPGLAAANSAVAAIRADTGAAAHQLDKLRLSAAEPPSDPDLLLVRDLVRMILGMKAGDADTVTDAAGHLIARTGQSPGSQVPGLNAAALLAQASTLFWHGRADDADPLLATALAEAERSGPPVVTLEVPATTALVDSIRSRPHHAEDAAHRAHAMLQKDGELSTPPPALELAAATRLLIAADVPGAAAALERAYVPDAVGTDPALAMAREIGWATVLLASGDVSRARTIAQRSPHTNLPVLTALHETLLADTETLLGRPHAALDLLRDYDGDLAVLAALPRARAHLALHDPGSAHDCVLAILATPSMLVNRYSLAEAMLYDAQIAQLNDDSGRAFEMTWGAIELAQDDIVLPFLAVYRTFAPLLARHPALAARWPRGPVSVIAPTSRRAARACMASSSGSGRLTLTSWMHAGSGSRPPVGWAVSPEASVTGHTFEIRVAGKLGPSAREAFADVIVDVESASTILSARLDQPGLHALLDRVRALGLELVDIQQAPDPPSAEPGEGDAAGLLSPAIWFAYRPAARALLRFMPFCLVFTLAGWLSSQHLRYDLLDLVTAYRSAPAQVKPPPLPPFPVPCCRIARSRNGTARPPGGHPVRQRAGWPSGGGRTLSHGPACSVTSRANRSFTRRPR